MMDAARENRDDEYPQISKAGVRTENLNTLFQLSAGYPQGHLYGKRNRILEQRDPGRD